MALTTKQIYDLNNSMVAAQNVNLGNLIGGIGVFAGTHVATASEETSGSVIITGSGSSIAIYGARIFRDDADVTGDASITASGSKVTITSSGSTATYAVTEGDVVNYFIL